MYVRDVIELYEGNLSKMEIALLIITILGTINTFCSVCVLSAILKELEKQNEDRD